MNTDRRGNRIVRAAALFLVAVPGFGQFDSLSTNSDGSLLFFTTALRQSGTSQPNYGKIFIVDDAGVQLLGVRDITRTPLGSFGGRVGSISNFYDLVGVDISSNSQNLSAVGLRECVGLTATLCGGVDQTTVYDSQGATVLGVGGRMALSPNGLWGVATALPLNAIDTRFTVVNLVTGQSHALPGVFSGGRNWRQHDVADDGTAIVVAGLGLHIFRPPDQIQLIPFPQASLQSAVLDASGKTLVWAQAGPPTSIRVAALEGGLRPVALPPVARHEFAPQISDDGQRLLVLSTALGEDNPQIYVIELGSLTRRKITNEPEGIVSATLSGNGEIAWALTRTGRIVKIEIATANVRTLTGPVAAFLANPGGEAVGVGQTIRLPASVRANEPLQVVIDGQAFPAVRVENQWVSFQVPWDITPVVSHEMSLRTTWESGWSGTSATFRANVFAPRFLARPAHEDLAAEVTESNPARPGERIHLYATGLGPVKLPPAVGMPAPESPPIATESPVTCSIGPTIQSQEAAEVSFAGLAPGRVGIYQVDLRLPASFPANNGELLIACSIPSSGLDFPFTILVPVSR